MQGGHGGIAHFHRQIAARHHDAVGGFQNFFQILDGFDPFDLGDQHGLATRCTHQLAGHVHVGRTLGEGDGNEIDADLGGGLDVVHVLGGECRGGEAPTLTVDALVVGQIAAHQNAGVNLMASHTGDFQFQAAVVEQQDVTALHVLGQFFVVQPDALVIAHRALGIENERRTRFERDLAAFKLADPDFRALQVSEDAHRAPQLDGSGTDGFGTGAVIFRRAVGEVHAHHVNPGADHALQNIG